MTYPSLLISICTAAGRAKLRRPSGAAPAFYAGGCNATVYYFVMRV